mmetsp:Transcript_56819/g.144014  ORF Transcript_56819/g.144014 Transcript_56819/m.144014 type:complete len:302 (-) Transcript_56819:304-1209(-)
MTESCVQCANFPGIAGVEGFPERICQVALDALNRGAERRHLPIDLETLRSRFRPSPVIDRVTEDVVDAICQLIRVVVDATNVEQHHRKDCSKDCEDTAHDRCEHHDSRISIPSDPRDPALVLPQDDPARGRVGIHEGQHHADGPVHAHHHGVGVGLRGEVQEEHDHKVDPDHGRIVVLVGTAVREEQGHEVDVYDRRRRAGDALPGELDGGAGGHEDREDGRLNDTRPRCEVGGGEETTPGVGLHTLGYEGAVVVLQDRIPFVIHADLYLRAHLVVAAHADVLVFLDVPPVLFTENGPRHP